MKKLKFAILAILALFAFSCSSASSGINLAGGGGTGTLVKISTESDFDTKVMGADSGFVLFMASKTDCMNCSLMKSNVLPAVAEDSGYSAVNFYYAETMGDGAELASIHSQKVFYPAHNAGVVGNSFATPIVLIIKNGKVIGGGTGYMDANAVKALIKKNNK